MKILFIGVSPKDQNQLRLRDEINIIKDTLDSNSDNNYKLVVRDASTKEAMRTYLNKHKPYILHISGHGNDDGTIIFEDKYGHSEIIYTKQLGKFLENYNKHLKCVVLSACYSLNNIEKLSDKIHCVIGMKTSIANKKAKEFSSAFYDALCSGDNFKNAYNKAYDELNLSQEEDIEILKIVIKPKISNDPVYTSAINWKFVGITIFLMLILVYILISFLKIEIS